jgi:hypothetical protein
VNDILDDEEIPFQRMNQMQQALDEAYVHRKEMDGTSIRDIAKLAGIPTSTLANAMAVPSDMRVSTLFRLWSALGFKVTIWCQGPGRRSYIFGE